MISLKTNKNSIKSASRWGYKTAIALKSNYGNQHHPRSHPICPKRCSVEFYGFCYKTTFEIIYKLIFDYIILIYCSITDLTMISLKTNKNSIKSASRWGYKTAIALKSNYGNQHHPRSHPICPKRCSVEFYGFCYKTTSVPLI